MGKYRVVVKYLDEGNQIGGTIGTKDIECDTYEEAQAQEAALVEQICVETPPLVGRPYNN